MKNANLEALKKAYAKASEMGRSFVKFTDGTPRYYANTAKEGFTSLQAIQDLIVDMECPLEAVVFEEDEAPTVLQFLEAGFEFVKGDERYDYYPIYGNVVTPMMSSVDYCNDAIKDNDEWLLEQKVRKLVPRKNTGMQPCDDDGLVNVGSHDIGSNDIDMAGDFCWNLDDLADINYWTPSKENFIKDHQVNETCPSDSTDYVRELEDKCENLSRELALTKQGLKEKDLIVESFINKYKFYCENLDF